LLNLVVKYAQIMNSIFYTEIFAFFCVDWNFTIKKPQNGIFTAHSFGASDAALKLLLLVLRYKRSFLSLP